MSGKQTLLKVVCAVFVVWVTGQTSLPLLAHRVTVGNQWKRRLSKQEQTAAEVE